jgi:hypothetical protein
MPLRGAAVSVALAGMGTKYQPSIRDQKDRERFQRQQSARPKPAKAAGPKSAKKAGKK